MLANACARLRLGPAAWQLLDAGFPRVAAKLSGAQLAMCAAGQLTGPHTLSTLLGGGGAFKHFY